MKKRVLILTVLLALTLCSCTRSGTGSQPSESTLPTETTLPIETTQPPEDTMPGTTIPPTTEPVAADPYAAWYTLLEYTYPENNWLRSAMGCVFTTPAEIDLYFLFYSGFRSGSWDKLSPESEQYLIDQGFERRFDIQPMPVSDLEAALQETFGISLADVTVPEEWVYLETEDLYCSNHNDAYGVHEYSITNVIESEDGRVEICYSVDHYYNTQTGEFLWEPTNLVLTLQETEDGSWLVCSNLIV